MAASHSVNKVPSPPDSGFREAEMILRVTKEIVIKFIEMGKVTPASLDEVFASVHGTVSAAATRHLPNIEASVPRK